MKQEFEVVYQITDRGTPHGEKKVKIVAQNEGGIFNALNHHLKKNAHAMDLSTRFSFEIISHEFLGHTF